MPFSRGDLLGDLLVPLLGSVRKPSASTSTGRLRSVSWSSLLLSGAGSRLPAAASPGRCPAGRGPAAARASRPTGTASLPRWLSRDSRSSGSAERGREAAGQRLGLVVEVDQERLVEAGLDEAVRVAVEARPRARSPARKRATFSASISRLEVRDRAGLRGRQVGRVAEREDVRRRPRLERVRVGRNEAERVAEPGRALDVRGAAVQRHGDEQVEVELAPVVAT